MIDIYYFFVKFELVFVLRLLQSREKRLYTDLFIYTFSATGIFRQQRCEVQLQCTYENNVTGEEEGISPMVYIGGGSETP